MLILKTYYYTDKKKKDIDNILEKVKEYQDECTLIEKQIKEYEDMV